MTKISYVGGKITPEQGKKLTELLESFPQGTEAHFGDVDNNNRDFHMLVSALNKFYIVMHPSFESIDYTNQNKPYYPYTINSVWPKKSSYDCDRDLISLCKLLISLPESTTVTLSRPWRMIEQAVLSNVNHIVVFPDGQTRFVIY